MGIIKLIENDDRENTPEESKRPNMRSKEHLMTLHGIGAHKRFAGISAAHAEDLDRFQLSGHPDLGSVPIHFRFPGTFRIQGDYCISRPAPLPFLALPYPQSDRHLRSHKLLLFNKTRINAAGRMPLFWRNIKVMLQPRFDNARIGAHYRSKRLFLSSIFWLKARRGFPDCFS